MSKYDDDDDDDYSEEVQKQGGKQGHSCCGCFCDMRRAVIIVNVLNIIFYIIILAFLALGYSSLNIWSTSLDTMTFSPTIAPTIPSPSPSLRTLAPSSLAPVAEVESPPVAVDAIQWEDTTLEPAVSDATTLAPADTPSTAPSTAPSSIPSSSSSSPSAAANITFTEAFDPNEFAVGFNRLLQYSFGIMAAIAGAVCLLLGLGIFGAIKFKTILVGLSLVVYLVFMVWNALQFDFVGVILQALFAYPHVGLILELNRGIMAPDTYADREKQSCCCV